MRAGSPDVAHAKHEMNGDRCSQAAVLHNLWSGDKISVNQTDLTAPRHANALHCLNAVSDPEKSNLIEQLISASIIRNI